MQLPWHLRGQEQRWQRSTCDPAFRRRAFTIIVFRIKYESSARSGATGHSLIA